MSTDSEIELKFVCAPEDLGAVLASAPEGDDDSRELISVYFDTADQVLQKAGVSLRVRESNGHRVQTVKRGEGVFREEHETPVAGHAPNPQVEPLKALLPEGTSLKPAFNVHVTRRQRLIRLGDAEIELSLDQGEVKGGRRSSPISEVELELKAGSLKVMFELARELSRAAPLYVSFEGKAARGQALIAGAPLQARKSAKIDLPEGATVAAAFQANARSALSQITVNAEVMRAAPQPEAIHQLRVGVRRLRSLIATFSSVVGDASMAGVKSELRWLADDSNRARNLDVLAEAVETAANQLDPCPAGLKALSDAVASAARRARTHVRQTVSSERFRTLMLEATAWVEDGDWLAASPAATDPVAAYARRALAKRRRKLLKLGRTFEEASDAGRHHVRIEAKKLRYAAEGLASLYPQKRVSRFVRRLEALQDELGELNDIATADGLFVGLPLTPEAAFAAGELAGLKRAAKPALVAHAAKALKRLGKAKPFWAR
ncbi:CHAD domain-containing protein [Phenylobacterium sp.]|jgi:inorganic triphosphatase YgiF|uniref:CYTH and CHAD domain-containing protein n=1 Tax=Phenylobacterium sp. TaxID=1871053 RepID=UPI002F40948D